MVEQYRPDVEDAASLNMLVMEMDEILRDHPDDDDGANSVSRSAFIGSVRNGAFASLLFPATGPARRSRGRCTTRSSVPLVQSSKRASISNIRMNTSEEGRRSHLDLDHVPIQFVWC